MNEGFVRFFGILIIVAASTGIGLKASDNLNVQLELLRKLKQLVILIEGEIKYNNSYLGQAFKNVSGRISNPYKELMIYVSDKLNERTGEPLEKIWKEGVENTLLQSGMSKKHLLKLSELGETLGYLDKDMQIANFELFIERLDMEINESDEKNKANCKLYKSLGVLSGILIVILII